MSNDGRMILLDPDGKVEYENTLRGHIDISSLEVFEHRIFYGLVMGVRDKGEELLTFNAYDFLRQIKFKRTSRKEREEILDRATSKIIDLKYSHRDGKKKREINLFSVCDTDFETGEIHLQVSKPATYIFNQIESNFTKFGWQIYVDIKKKYAQNLFIRIVENHFKGTLYFTYEELINELKIPQGRQVASDVKKIIDDSINALEVAIDGISYQIHKSTSRGGRVLGYTFEWDTTKKSLRTNTVVEQPKPLKKVELKELWLRETYIPNQPNKINNPEGLIKSLMAKYKTLSLEEMQLILSNNKSHQGKIGRQEPVPDWLNKPRDVSGKDSLDDDDLVKLQKMKELQNQILNKLV
jgi:Protein involved in initiation of plasmid replication